MRNGGKQAIESRFNSSSSSLVSIGISSSSRSALLIDGYTNVLCYATLCSIVIIDDLVNAR